MSVGIYKHTTNKLYSFYLQNTTTSYATLVLLDVDVKIHDEPEFEEPKFLLSSKSLEM